MLLDLGIAGGVALADEVAAAAELAASGVLVLVTGS
jgi:hypothetical protein